MLTGYHVTPVATCEFLLLLNAWDMLCRSRTIVTC